MTIKYKLSYTAQEIDERLNKIDSLAEKSEIPKKVSELTNDSGFLTSIPSEYVTENELNAKGYLTEHQDLSDYALKSEIPDALSDLTGDATHRTVTDVEKSTWNAKSDFSGSYNDLTNKPIIPSIDGLATETYVQEQIEAIPTPDVSGQINTHNTATDAHNDIRLDISGLVSRLNALADSDDTTLDQMSEIVAYIKSNKSLIDSITTGKVNVSDIIDNLTTNISSKPLSAAQGVTLKALIDAIVVPTKVSELTNDSGFLTSYTETDPTVPMWAKAASKPSYSKSEVGLENVDNIKQYSTENPPVVCQSAAPVDISVIWVDPDDNYVDEFQEAVNTALAQAKTSGEFNPVKGTDYWTEADQEDIIQQVITALGTPVFGRVDTENNIILTGELADGTYTFKYEDDEGKTTDIGSLKIGGASYTNQLPISTDANGAIYNGTGYKVGYRINSSGGEVALGTSASNPAFITGFIPATTGQTVYLENCYIDTIGINGSASSTETKSYYGDACSSLNIYIYNAQKATQNCISWVNAVNSDYISVTPDADGIAKAITIKKSGIAYIRITLAGDAPNAIITVDEPITD